MTGLSALLDETLRLTCVKVRRRVVRSTAESCLKYGGESERGGRRVVRTRSERLSGLMRRYPTPLAFSICRLCRRPPAKSSSTSTIPAAATAKPPTAAASRSSSSARRRESNTWDFRWADRVTSERSVRGARRGREKSEIGTGAKGVGQRFERAAGAKGAGPDLGGVAENIFVAPVGPLFVETGTSFNWRK